MTDARRSPEISGSRSRAVSRSHIPCSRRPACGLAIANVRLAAGASSAVGDVGPPDTAGGSAGANASGDAGARADAGAGAIGATELLLQVRIVVARAASVRRIVPPVLGMCAAIDIDASA